VVGRLVEKQQVGALPDQHRQDEARLFAEREKIEAVLADPSTTPAQLADGGKRLKAIGEQIETLEARWLDLSTRIDQLAEAPG